MLRKNSRLGSEEFRSRAYRTIKTPYFLLKAKPSTTKTPKIGVVVGRAVHKSAVKRNFWKRQAKDALSKVTIGKDFLIIFSPNVGTITKKQFRDALAKALKQ